ncbi:hypothetical protein [Flagellimonas onchidii]|uniref:hypothetical protein n=1 Tax=Flagellimonas onchidii TaxID=2562684 RepID=UPI001455E04F|nr:hypothetical protein [Allomuricauda onchidii]
MLKLLLEILQSQDFYGISEEIEIAKGRNAIPKSMTQALNQAKRHIFWQSRKR